MATATAFCPSNTPFHQHTLSSPRSQYSNVVSRRTTLSSSSSATFSSNLPLTTTDSLTFIKITTSDENNNHEQQFDESSMSDDDDILYIANEHEHIDHTNNNDNDDDDDQIIDNSNIEELLSFVGLRLKTKQPKSIIPNFPSLKDLKRKDLLRPICLLPIPKYGEHIRKVLYMHLPLLKHLSITFNIEDFCTTDENARAQSLLPRTNVLTRALSTLNKSPKKTKLLQKGDLISMATSALRKNTCQTSKNKYVRSILECNVILDRLDKSVIDQIMQNVSDEDNQMQTKILSQQESLDTDQLPIITNCETIQIQSPVKTVTTKRQLSTNEMNSSKRFKSIENTSTVIENSTNSDDLLSFNYERIYLKCFVCSKCQFIDAQVTDSDVLHTHWREHSARLSLNIYDSEIDSILTRVVEFFNLPRDHSLEGKIKKIYIYNSLEIRSTTTTKLSKDDSYIVID